MKIPRSYVQAYSAALNGVTEQARKSLAAALEQVDMSGDVASVRDQVSAIMQQACGASSTVAARLAADFYDGLRARFGIEDGYQADPDPEYNPDATDGAVRAFAKKLVDEDPERFKALCVERIDRETRRTANECMARNARRDPKRPKWARVPTGAETCPFCIMLASRGFAYHSEEAASHAHPHCDCRIVPSWDKSPTAQGYDPDFYYRIWRRIENAEMVDGSFYSETRSEIRALIKEYERGFNDSWRRYKLQGKKSAIAYQANVGAYLGSLTVGNLQAEPFTHLEGKEILLGRWISDSGQDVQYLKPSNDNRKNDAIINGLPWEFKQITSSDPLKIKDRIEEGKGQSENIIIDLSLSNITKEQAMVQAAYALEDNAVKTVMIVKAGKLYLLER